MEFLVRTVSEDENPGCYGFATAAARGVRVGFQPAPGRREMSQGRIRLRRDRGGVPCTLVGESEQGSTANESRLGPTRLEARFLMKRASSF